MPRITDTSVTAPAVPEAVGHRWPAVVSSPYSESEPPTLPEEPP